MKQNLIQKSLILFAMLFLLCISTFAQDRTNLKDKCILVLDVQNYSTSSSENSTHEMIQHINSILEKANPDNVVYFKALHRVLYLTKKGFSTGIDTIGMDIDKRLNIVNANIITKKESNAFTEIELIQFLQKNNLKEVIVIGLMAELCVKETIIGGKDLGYNMYFIPEAIMGKTEKKKEKILSKLVEKGAQRLPINEL